MHPSRTGSKVWLAAALVLAATTVPALAASVEATGTHQSLYVVNNQPNGLVSQYNIGADGALSRKDPPTVPAADSARGVAVSPDGLSVYVANGNDGVSQYDVGPGGILSSKSPPVVAAGARPLGVAVSPDGLSVYVANEGSSTVSQYDVGPSGALTPKDPATVLAFFEPREVAVSPNGESVYVTARVRVGFEVVGAVFQYDVGQGGVLSPKSTPWVLAQNYPRDVAVSPDGLSVYVANESRDSISQYDVGSDGALSPKDPPAVPAGGPFPAGLWGVVVSPNGQSVYVTNSFQNSVSQYDVGPGGVLLPKSPPTVPTEGTPLGVAMSSDGQNVYVANLSGTVSQYDVGPGGTLSPKSPQPVPANGAAFALAVGFANHAPDCVGVTASPNPLLPAARDEFRTITFLGSDPEGDPFTVHIDGVTQDEPVSGEGIGDDTFPDAELTPAGADSDQLRLRAERSPMKDGRVYRVSFTLTDVLGASCSGSATVSVPRRSSIAAVDSAPPSYDSFTGASV